MVTAFQFTLTFKQYPLFSMSNVNVNLVYWNSLHKEKEAISHTFLGQTLHVLGEKKKKPTPSERCVLCQFVSLRAGV